jgi:hypothetical protein
MHRRHDPVVDGVTIHARESWGGDLSASERDSLATFIRSMGNEEVLGDLRADAVRVLAATELPTSVEPVERVGDGWRPLDEGAFERALAERRSFSGSTVLDLVKDRPHSSQWFAAQVLFHSEIALQALARGDAATAVYNALRASGFHTMAVCKFAWEADVLAGRAARRNLVLACEARVRTVRNFDMLDEYEQLRKQGHPEKTAITKLFEKFRTVDGKKKTTDIKTEAAVRTALKRARKRRKEILGANPKLAPNPVKTP